MSFRLEKPERVLQSSCSKVLRVDAKIYVEEAKYDEERRQLGQVQTDARFLTNRCQWLLGFSVPALLAYPPLFSRAWNTNSVLLLTTFAIFGAVAVVPGFAFVFYPRSYKTRLFSQGKIGTEKLEIAVQKRKVVQLDRKLAANSFLRKRRQYLWWVNLWVLALLFLVAATIIHS